ncbi:hypothetical protein [Arcicella rigui]|uniref:DUF5683 domain-containing protein n=1 Tax=Arcicella rigui TaxID=797020 RepID=A0ABU5Q7Z9_9BACT|nr:hypothetical protein [Arcicella rigui]MEA5138976.1 hypothetical protein [Arcicella rigui]
MNLKKYSIVLYYILLTLCSVKSNISFAQTKVVASNVELQNEMLKISFNISTNSMCLNLFKVELIETKSKKKTVINHISGELNNLNSGNHTVFWDFKQDGIFVDSEFEVIIQLEPCGETEPKPSQNENKFVYKPHSVGMKIGVLGVGILSGFFANSIKRNFDSKVEILKSIESSFPLVDGYFISKNGINTWNTAYTDAQNAQKTALLNTMVAVSVLSLGYEVLLLTTKVKVPESKFSLQLPSNSSGLSLIYKF